MHFCVAFFVAFAICSKAITRKLLWTSVDYGATGNSHIRMAFTTILVTKRLHNEICVIAWPRSHIGDSVHHCSIRKVKMKWRSSRT